MGPSHGESFTFVGETDESVWEMGDFSSVGIHFGADHLTSALGPKSGNRPSCLKADMPRKAPRPTPSLPPITARNRRYPTLHHPATLN